MPLFFLSFLPLPPPFFSLVNLKIPCRLFGTKNLSKYLLPQSNNRPAQSVDSSHVLLAGTTTNIVSDCLRDRETLTTIMPDLLNTFTLVNREKKELELTEMVEVM